MTYTIEQLQSVGIDTGNAVVNSGLTAQQEAFCQAYVFGGMTKTAAYRHIYDVSADTKPNSVNEMACRLSSKPHVAARINQLFALQTGKYSLDTGRIRTVVINELLEQVEHSGSEIVRQRAAIALAKMPAVGLYEHAKEDDSTDTTATVNKLQELVNSIKARVIDHDKEPPLKKARPPRARKRKDKVEES